MRMLNLVAENQDLSKSKSSLEERLDNLTLLVEENARKSDMRFEELDMNRTATIRNHDEYMAWRHVQDARNLRLYKANFIPTFVGVLCSRTGVSMKSLESKKTDDQHCASPFSKAYTLFEQFSKAESWKRKTGLRHEYYKDLKGVQALFDERNLAAYESSSHFARLLTDSVFIAGPNKALTDYYAPLFEYCYAREDGADMTLAECAEVEESVLKQRLRTHLDKPEEPQRSTRQQAGSKKRQFTLE
ncbi:MAG: hypothetical protein Q9174_006576 [Haloplaca sp. 1 TL-2023]